MRSDKGHVEASYIAIAQIQSVEKSISKHHLTMLFQGGRVVQGYVSEKSAQFGKDIHDNIIIKSTHED